MTSQDDGSAQHHLNQYIIKQEIGRGSFGAVHLAVDQYGQEYVRMPAARQDSSLTHKSQAVKEFSKSRLRKRAQSNLLRKPLSQRRRAQPSGKGDFNSPLHRAETGGNHDRDTAVSSIDLIKEEIAVMKKLNHNNIVSLIEVLDDPSEDSLYMVMEMCKKGVVMKVGLDEVADPYPDETCRCWFRDLLLGIEYLHAQGIVHRDIKPDNCLINDDDVLKVVDFGVSEMFQKESEMMTRTSKGSPAFLPPELCVIKHGDISARAADIWSMGVTLYCMKYGKVPFNKTNIFEMYDAIKDDEVKLDGESDEDFRDLMKRILEKDPTKRIKMPELRNHPWVTKRGEDPLLSEEENVSDLVEPPTESEMNAAITGNIRQLMTVMRAVRKFKSLAAQRHPTESILGVHANQSFSQPPGAYDKAVPTNADVCQAEEGVNAVKGISREPVPSSGQNDGGIGSKADETDANALISPPPLTTESSTDSADTLAEFSTQIGSEKYRPFRAHQRADTFAQGEVGQRGHAHDPLEDQLYLYIGPSTFSGPSVHRDGRPSMVPEENEDIPIVSESPGAADMDIYETAYRDEIERIRAKVEQEETEEGKEPTVYLTRRVDEKLMALSGHAGRLMAMGEEGLDQVRDFTRFRERRAKVTDVSKALRDAARQEYEKRRRERKDQLAASKAERVKSREAASISTTADNAEGVVEIAAETAKPVESEPSPGLSRFRTTGSLWGSKAVDKGKQASGSFKGLVSSLTSKSKGQDQGDA
jgi:calcium/calmodulin-dependent protein kinase kinase 2